jgi:hypothetical protein
MTRRLPVMTMLVCVLKAIGIAVFAVQEAESRRAGAPASTSEEVPMGIPALFTLAPLPGLTA